MQLFQKLACFMCLCLLFCVIACNKSKDEPASKLNPGNADALSQALKIPGAVSKQGTPPAPAADPDAPSIALINNEKIRTASGFTFLLGADVEGNAAGFYIQVNNAKTYYQVPLTSGGRIGGKYQKFPFQQARKTSSARIQSEDGTIYVPIELPANITPGEFCITYCVYDDQGRVSNLVTKCIQIVEFGGDKSIAKSWSATKSEYDGESEQIGTEYCEDYSMLCNSEDVEYQFCYKIDKFDMILNENGSLQLLYKDSMKSPGEDFWDNCTTLEYETQVYDTNFEGGWTYNATTKQLVLVLNYSEFSEELEVVPVELVVTKLTDTELIVLDSDDGLTYFVKK